MRQRLWSLAQWQVHLVTRTQRGGLCWCAVLEGLWTMSSIDAESISAQCCVYKRY